MSYKKRKAHGVAFGHGIYYVMLCGCRYTWPQPNSMLVQKCSERPGDYIYKVFGTGLLWN